jgi:hypothetical protein
MLGEKWCTKGAQMIGFSKIKILQVETNFGAILDFLFNPKIVVSKYLCAPSVCTIQV